MKEKLNILIVEDDRGFSDLLTRLAREEGHEAVAALGAASLHPFVGLARDGSLFAIEPDRFDLALCDFELKRASGSTERYNGNHFVELLVPAGVLCHAMSSIPVLNQQLIDLGAKSGCMKPFVLLALKGKVVSFEMLYNAPEKAGALIGQFMSELMADPEALSARISAICDETETAK